MISSMLIKWTAYNRFSTLFPLKNKKGTDNLNYNITKGFVPADCEYK